MLHVKFVCCMERSADVGDGRRVSFDVDFLHQRMVPKFLHTRDSQHQWHLERILPAPAILRFWLIPTVPGVPFSEILELRFFPGEIIIMSSLPALRLICTALSSFIAQKILPQLNSPSNMCCHTMTVHWDFW